ncbi:DUF4426 domain-containing protein [Kangiella profundi]|uniref:DUF4426 domain-containing protein n=1 Tax=Kangiella profundi TaxID=1561924 RepID=A0A2K9AN64_9GAMM|nr:DUF4426 domain-containing protein [Kangiella profundi]AUD77853.1 DUF4426 domain-containing protein [Kangiella profundi]MBD3667787.1 DUF4426 domain-containing protein [Kangiella sp.]GGE91967.1 hypothetical protein GCM10011356_02630 [Kangiella profundi]
MYTTIKSLMLSLVGAALLLANTATAAEKKVGDYIIYYNAFNSSFLQPDVASTYKIPRSGLTAILNVSVHKAGEPTEQPAVPANIQGKVTNSLSQFKNLAFKEIKEEKAIYYIADFQFRPEEDTSIEFTVKVPGMERPETISFKQKFFAE